MFTCQPETSPGLEDQNCCQKTKDRVINQAQHRQEAVPAPKDLQIQKLRALQGTYAPEVRMARFPNAQGCLSFAAPGSALAPSRAVRLFLLSIPCF